MAHEEITERFAFQTPADALDALIARLSPVATEKVPVAEAAGRVLAETVRTDRPSPSCSVSAMDGYAVCLADLSRDHLQIVGEARIGRPAPALEPGVALRIFTGSMVPAEAEAVVKREDVTEDGDRIILSETARASARGQFIRVCGENAPAGETVIQPGRVITAPVMSALASFGVSHPRVYRKVRATILVTGDELLPVEAAPKPWQLRESNGYTLRVALASCSWMELLEIQHIVDEPDRMNLAVTDALNRSDAVILSGGVSMGTRDYVPAAIRSAGCDVVFHRIPIRPGRPTLGAVGPDGQLVLGLPGNPVSVMVTSRRFGLPALARRAGVSEPIEKPAVVALDDDDGERLDLWWYRPVRLTGDGMAALIANRGSGDLVATVQSDGFVEIPPNAAGLGPWPFYAWR
ncbi:MAG: molybdopterin molybdotransferase MoeA [Phycisphaerales bacterium]|nr:molybdopterin molybdotransferase MoeA [Phycisphaerales bacterium]